MSHDPPGVFAVRCPNPQCRKYMLVEESDRSEVVPCLLCRTPIRVGLAATSATPQSSKPTPAPTHVPTPPPPAR
jgi:hypothetical protein